MPRPKRVTLQPELEQTNPQLYDLDPGLAKDLAKRAYFRYVDLKTIRESYGIPAGTLNAWCHKKTGTDRWYEKRIRKDNAIIDDIYKSRKKDCEHVFGLSVHNLKRGLAALLTSQRNPTTNEMQQLISIAKDMQVILRLEAGEATQIVKNVDASPEGIRKLLEEMQEADPYVDYGVKKDVEDKEVLN